MFSCIDIEEAILSDCCVGRVFCLNGSVLAHGYNNGWMQNRGAISGMDWIPGRGMEHLTEQKSKPEIVDKSSVPSH